MNEVRPNHSVARGRRRKRRGRCKTRITRRKEEEEIGTSEIKVL